MVVSIIPVWLSIDEILIEENSCNLNVGLQELLIGFASIFALTTTWHSLSPKSISDLNSLNVLNEL